MIFAQNAAIFYPLARENGINANNFGTSRAVEVRLQSRPFVEKRHG